jgi:hypothetical protein
MSDNSWVLKGVDTATRQRAVDEAARLGVSLADFLTEILLSGAPVVDSAIPDVAAPPPPFDPPPEAPRENFALRHRLEALERRFGLSIGGLDGALHTLDSAVFGLAGRVDDSEVLATETAETLNQALQEFARDLAAYRKRLADAEEGADAFGESNEAAHADLATRCDRLDEAHDALMHAVASDFTAFARESAARLGAGLDEMRADAESAAEQADAALERLSSEMHALRKSLEDRLSDSAAETRGRMQAAFAAAADQLGALAERVVDSERMAARNADHLRAQIVDAEDAAQAAIEEAAQSLRQADAALAAECSRTGDGNRAVIEATRAAFALETSDLRERQLGALARLQVLDSALGNTTGEVATLRDALDLRLAACTADARRDLAQAQTLWSERLEVRAAAGEQSLAQSRQALGDDIARVEACTMAALQKLAGDLAAGDALLAKRIEAATRCVEAAATESRQEIDRDLANLHEQQSAALAPLAEQLSRAESELGKRLSHLEHAAEQAETEQTITILQEQVDRLAAHVGEHQSDENVFQRIDDLRARLAAQEANSAEAADRVHGVARMLGRVTAQSADAATQSEGRLHKLELALADMRLAQFSSPAAEVSSTAASEAVASIAQKLVDLELRQAEAFENLRADISHFISENDRRLAVLEGASPLDLDAVSEAIEGRLSQIEQRDIGADFDALRRRIEDRVLSVENRSVRALEQVSETVALIERRMVEGANSPAARTA